VHAEILFGRHLGKAGAADQQGFHLGEIAFGALAEIPVQMLVDHEPEHRVAEKFQTFVGIAAHLPGHVDV